MTRCTSWRRAKTRTALVSARTAGADVERTLRIAAAHVAWGIADVREPPIELPSSAFLKFKSYLSPHRARAPRLRGSALRAARDGLRAARPKGCGDRCSVAPRLPVLLNQFPVHSKKLPVPDRRLCGRMMTPLRLLAAAAGARRRKSRSCWDGGAGVGEIFCGVFLRIIKYSGTNREHNAGSPEF